MSRTLKELLSRDLDISRDWAIYAEKIDGKFEEESEARFGKIEFENGGVLDNKEFVERNEVIENQKFNWLDGEIEDDELKNSMVEEWISQFLDEING